MVRSAQHVTPRGGGFGFRHVVKVRTTYIAHMDLISNCIVGNVYTDIKVYNTPSFWFKLIET
jgi:hypothetical protein